MRNRILIIGAVAFLAYILGSRAARANSTESTSHQLVRLWNDPKARRSRGKTARKIAKNSRAATKKAVEMARSKRTT